MERLPENHVLIVWRQAWPVQTDEELASRNLRFGELGYLGIRIAALAYRSSWLPFELSDECSRMPAEIFQKTDQSYACPKCATITPMIQYSSFWLCPMCRSAIQPPRMAVRQANSLPIHDPS